MNLRRNRLAGLTAVATALALGAAGCAATETPAPELAAEVTAPEVEGPAAPPAPDTAQPGDSALEGHDGAAQPRPEWLGTRVLPIAPDGFGERLPTPPELVDRRLRTPPLPTPAPAPPADGTFRATIGPVPDAIRERSTWTPACPVTLDELRYLTLTFYGFDGLAHTGELLVHRDVAEDVAGVFAALHAARFPLEEVRVIAAHELDLPPTGDGNVTSGFVCRPTVGGTRWSEHAYGRAIDVNPFHNPYVRGELILPELAGAYVDRSDVRPGMVIAGDAVTGAFAAIGWGWGGEWTGAATDPMHFSVTGR
jgi:hypothetical protein